jgi:hypothetical protein
LGLNQSRLNESLLQRRLSLPRKDRSLLMSPRFMGTFGSLAELLSMGKRLRGELGRFLYDRAILFLRCVLKSFWQRC